MPVQHTVRRIPERRKRARHKAPQSNLGRHILPVRKPVRHNLSPVLGPPLPRATGRKRLSAYRPE
jgi:hypothetical protein